ncbi:MAG: tRNA lysidine(34) synthetase TilS [Methylobacterium sp.]
MGDRLARALAPYLLPVQAPAGRILLAVSGGPDSTALLHAAARLGSAVSLAVATVDHGLRPEAAGEAEAVGQRARELGLSHTTLRWETRPRGGIQAAARAARYRLLAAHASEIGAHRVLTGHTADDQAETVLMRLIAGSGPTGLAGMRRERTLAEGIRLARPFLDLPKAELVAYCETHGLSFVTDPANADIRFARARLRALAPLLAGEGLTTERLTRLAERLARDETALSRAAAGLLDTSRRPSAAGTLALDGPGLLAAPEALALRVLDLALEAVQPASARAVPRRLERLERLVLDALLPALARGEPLRRTLRGVLVEAASDGTIRVVPAPPRRIFGQGP